MCVCDGRLARETQGCLGLEAATVSQGGTEMPAAVEGLPAGRWGPATPARHTAPSMLHVPCPLCPSLQRCSQQPCREDTVNMGPGRGSVGEPRAHG